MKTLIKIIIAVALIAMAGAAAYFYLKEDNEKIVVENGRIADVRTLAELCTVDFYNEVPVLDTVDNIVIFAVQKQQGSISFDIENIDIDDTGDTVRVTLPKEIIEVHESTEPNSWQVIDTKNIGFLGPLRNDRLTNAQENRVKAKLRSDATRRLYRDGTVRQARTDAAAQLQSLLEKIYRRPVRVEYLDSISYKLI